MDLKITVTLSDRLFELLEDKLPNLGRRFEKVLTKELGRELRETTEIRVQAVPSERPVPAGTDAVATVPAVDDKAVKAAPESQQPAAPDSGAALTAEDIRAAMHRTRQRFEGEDYRDHTDSESYKKYHKALTAQFKQIAALLGADKPSALPDDKRAAFIAECDALTLDESGNIAPSPSPF
ncbi:MAG: hypothetical protein NC117_02905 [Pseudoflavonifractor sp.]|nr:hypothetical protein [Pseudoflavonifractor sp.]